MLRFSVCAMLAFSLLISAPVSAAPLQPTSPWNVNYTATSCDAKRRFGDTAIVITPSPLGQTFRVMLEMPGGASRAQQFPARLSTGDGGEPDNVTAMIYPLSKKGLRGLYSVLPRSNVERVFKGGELEIRVGGGYTKMHAHLALGKMDGLEKALETCLADLQKHWGMVDGKLPDPAVASYAQGNMQGLFRSDDYPADAFLADQSGQSKFLLMIGKQGEVMDCIVLETSRVASLDAMGCQVIRERAKFKPAMGVDGQPMFSTVTQSLRWVLQ